MSFIEISPVQDLVQDYILYLVIISLQTFKIWNSSWDFLCPWWIFQRMQAYYFMAFPQFVFFWCVLTIRFRICIFDEILYKWCDLLTVSYLEAQRICFPLLIILFLRIWIMFIFSTAKLLLSLLWLINNFWGNSLDNAIKISSSNCSPIMLNTTIDDFNY